MNHPALATPPRSLLRKMSMRTTMSNPNQIHRPTKISMVQKTSSRGYEVDAIISPVPLIWLV
jgi:hypothetical protein